MMSNLIRPFFVVAVLAAAPALASADELRLESASLPAPFLNGETVDGVLEASGVEPIGDGRRWLVAHDKLPALHVVDASTGRFLGAPITSAKFPAAVGGAPKWEGMARDSEGNYYIIGSHSGKTDNERAGKGVLLRFRLKDVESGSPSIDDSSVTRWHIAGSLVAALKAQGLDDAHVAKRKIEGLAIREGKGNDGATRRELVVGLREPSDLVRAFAADITGNPSPDAELELKPAFRFDAGLREGVALQLTSLDHVAALGGFLVMTASEDAGNAFHGNSLWFVADAHPDVARKVATFEVAMKAEGLAVLGSESVAGKTTVRLLITYDNDPHSTKIPSRFQTVTLVRETK